MRELYDSRWDQAADPHTRCKPSGGSRFWHTPYGIEIVELPETQEIIFLHVGSPHSWRIAYMDGREHPKDLKPSWYGHSTAKWEGDTLVMDTVGFNDRFWLTREGVPMTSQLHLVEKLSRPNRNQLRYEATVDDPGAYTAPWTGGWNLRWGVGQRALRLSLPGKQPRSGAHDRWRRRGQQPPALGVVPKECHAVDNPVRRRFPWHFHARGSHHFHASRRCPRQQPRRQRGQWCADRQVLHQLPQLH